MNGSESTKTTLSPQFALSLVLCSCAVLAACVAFMSGCATVEPPVIKVGTNETVVTAPIGTPMSGYRRTDVSKSIHDDLYARTLVIEGIDGTSVALMTVAVLNMGADIADTIREGINRKTGIPSDNIVISCTHTHSGPTVGPIDGDYEKLLIERCIASCVDAWNKRAPGRIGIGSTIVPDLGKNDRRMEYGGIHPDPEVGIIKIEDAHGKLLGVAFNYGCHPSTLNLFNLAFTEDWPFYSIKGIRDALGRDVWVAYFQSAQGDAKIGYTAELSAVGADMSGIRTFEFAEHKGNMMIEPVLETLPTILTSDDPTIMAANGYFDYPRRESYPITAAVAQKQYAEAKTKLAEMEKKADSFGSRVIDRYKVDVFLAELTADCATWVENNPDPAPIRNVRHQAVRIGDAVFATFPCEVFTEIGLKVKQQSPFEKTFVFGIAAGHEGYIPTAAEYLEGGYAVVMTRYDPKCENVCIEASLDVISRVKD
jgi:neutral ceramidase